MENYIPDAYEKSIYYIDYEKLKERGIKCILFDLDNTIVPLSIKKPNKKIKEFFKKIKEMGFKIIIFSNSTKARIKPFKEELEVDCAFSCKKPMKKKYELILKEYRFNVSEVVIVGDNIVTDILGGNKVGITTILVNPISSNEKITTKISRLYEKRIISKLAQKELFYRGKYYE
jgi:hypothetical protein